MCRYMDDIVCFNCKEFMDFSSYIYRNVLKLKRTNINSILQADFLDCTYNLITSHITVYDKTRDFNFDVLKYMKSSSVMPNQIKLGILYSQLTRVFRISTSLLNFELELHNIFEIFIQNDFAISQLEPIFTKFVINNYRQFRNFNIYSREKATKFILKIIKIYK